METLHRHNDEALSRIKKPFAGPKQVLAYLARYTHRVAIANSRLLDLDETHVSFRWTDYRESGHHKGKVMRLDVGEFMRRFLLHVLPTGFHRIRHYGLFANGHRADKLTLCRRVLDVPSAPTHRDNDDDNAPAGSNPELPPCPCCAGRMIIIEVFDGPLSRPSHVRRLDGL
jgi:Putative transposase